MKVNQNYTQILFSVSLIGQAKIKKIGYVSQGCWDTEKQVPSSIANGGTNGGTTPTEGNLAKAS